MKFVPAPKKLSGVSKSPGDPLRPYIAQHSKPFDFTPFIQIGRPFLTAVVKAFSVRAGTTALSTAKVDYYSLCCLLRWIQERSSTFPNFREKLIADYETISVDDWEGVLSSWRNELVNSRSTQAETTKGSTIRRINILVEAFVYAGIIPPIARLTPISHSNKKGRPKKCLGEVSGVKRPNEPNLNNKSRKPRQAVETLARMNQVRLDALRRCAEEEFRYWSAHFQYGQRLVSQCDLPFAEIKRILHTKYLNRGFRCWALRRLFPKESPEITLSRYLTYVSKEYTGLITKADTKCRAFHSAFCQARGLKIENLKAYLYPHPHLTNAVQIMFMIDTGANVAVCHSLERDCLAPSDIPRHKTIAGFKDRARGKLIVADLPITDSKHEISCVQAVESYRLMATRLSEIAPVSARNKLFLHVFGRCRIGPIDYSAAQKQFRKFLSRHKELRGLPLSTDMIRPTVLFQKIYQSGGNLMNANASANHATLSTTSLYARAPEARLIYEDLIREFQLLFQTVAISEIRHAPDKINVTANEFDELLQRAHHTGLGVGCLNPKAGFQPGTSKGKWCTTLQNCPRCPLRFVVATIPNITDLILFHRHLRTSQTEFEATRPERWLNVWLPWLVFAEIALEKLQRGSTAEIYLHANLVAKERIASGTVNLPPLW